MMDCPGRRHGTTYAYRYCGCRCPDAVEKMRPRRERRQQPGRLLRGPKSRSPILDEIAVELACYGEPVTLTVRERAEAVAVLTARGLSGKQIAQRLGLSPRSVCRYRAGFQRFGKAA